jgi:hypothetical protein
LQGGHGGRAVCDSPSRFVELTIRPALTSWGFDFGSRRMFGRIGLYLIPVLLPVALPLALHASKLETITFNAADFTGAVQGGEVVPAIVKAQVLLDRASISSGEIDGKPSPRLDEAIAAFAEIHNLPADTGWSRRFWDELTSEAIVPALNMPSPKTI